MEVTSMVAVHELSWEEVSSPDFGNPTRAAWRQAVADIVAKDPNVLAFSNNAGGGPRAERLPWEQESGNAEQRDD